jgi:hypothetical protein
MRLRVTSFLPLITLAAVAAASTALLLGQAPTPAGRGAAPAAAPAIPRTADGKPDFSGIWQVLDNSLEGSIEPHSASWGVHAGQGAIIDTPDGMIPYTPAGLAKRNENYKNRAKDPVSQCWKPGVPRIMFQPFPFQITQAPKMIQMTFELVHNRRDIYINDSKHLEGIEFFLGDSRAKWEGDTLVVDVTNFMDDPTRETWLDGSGNYHSPALHVVERYTFNGPDMITYQATLSDPKAYTRPFTIEFLLYRHKGRNFRVMEYECQIFKEQFAREGRADILRLVEGK